MTRSVSSSAKPSPIARACPTAWNPSASQAVACFRAARTRTALPPFRPVSWSATSDRRSASGAEPAAWSIRNAQKLESGAAADVRKQDASSWVRNVCFGRTHPERPRLLHLDSCASPRDQDVEVFGHARRDRCARASASLASARFILAKVPVRATLFPAIDMFTIPCFFPLCTGPGASRPRGLRSRSAKHDSVSAWSCPCPRCGTTMHSVWGLDTA